MAKVDLSGEFHTSECSGLLSRLYWQPTVRSSLREAG